LKHPVIRWGVHEKSFGAISMSSIDLAVSHKPKTYPDNDRAKQTPV